MGEGGLEMYCRMEQGVSFGVEQGGSHAFSGMKMPRVGGRGRLFPVLAWAE